MHIARWQQPDGTVGAGLLAGDRVVPLQAPGSTVGDAVAIAVAGSGAEQVGESIPLAEVRLLCPLPSPPSIRDFMAFEEHVKNARGSRGLDVPEDWYELPAFYFTNPAVVYGPADAVPMPGTERLDYELEVAAIVGRDGADLTVEEAADAIVGYTIFNDWSARDLQLREMALMLGPAKGKDFAHSLGPVIATPDELGGDPARPRARMRAWVNGTLYTDGELGDMHFSFADLVVHAARDSRVRAGDLIGSGTVGGGCILELSHTVGPDERPWLYPGDEVVFEVEGIGQLTNRIGGRRG